MIGVLQFCPRRGEVERNLEDLLALTRDALAEGVRLLVLPEMAATGYRFAGPGEVHALAEPLTGRTIARLGALAREREAWLVAGFPEVDGGLLFNSAAVLEPGGSVVARYRKRCLYEDDWTWAEPGDLPYPSFQTPWGVATVGICMDINDPGFTRHVVRTQPAIVCFPTNWIDQGLPSIHAYWADRLDGHEGYLLAADRWGSEDGVTFWGRSAILRAGEVLASLPARGSGWVAVDPRTGTCRRRLAGAGLDLREGRGGGP